jgi:hypothetical protein
VKKLLAFVLTFGLLCAITSTVGCSKKEEAKADSTKKEDEKDKKKT